MAYKSRVNIEVMWLLNKLTPDFRTIAGFQVTNSPADRGQITDVAGDVKNEYGVDILEATADKGYESPEDHANALASGIVPNVIQRDGSCTEEVKFD